MRRNARTGKARCSARARQRITRLQNDVPKT